jgi:hypothetical protein
MACLTPILIKNEKRRSSKDFAFLPVPCGKCPNCLKRRSNNWVFRLLKEQEISNSSNFITLTYEEDSLPVTGDGEITLCKRDVQKFVKRLRKHIETYTEKKNQVKYYICGEYGTQTDRPHYHCILFGLPSLYTRDNNLLSSIWGLGNLKIDPCNTATIRYVTKYIMKKVGAESLSPTRQPEFSLMSKGMGASFLTPKTVSFYKEKLIPYLIVEDGVKISMPRYYRNKIYNENEIKKVNAKTIANLEKQGFIFDDFQHEADYIRNEFQLQERKNKVERIGV